MSIHSPDFSGHITITAPDATTVPSAPYTFAALFKNRAGIGTFVWNGYQPNNFSKTNLYFDGDVWFDFDQADLNLDISTSKWWWVVVTKDAVIEAPRVHVAEYLGTGTMTWIHDVVGTTEQAWGDIDRFSIGDEFASGFGGDLAVFTAFNVEYDDAGVEALFQRSSADILAASPNFFVHFPESLDLGDPFEDIAGGGVETIRTGDWSLSADPPNYVFSSGRSGNPKVWNGTSWAAHPAKVWNGSSWVAHPMKGYTGTEFIASK